MRVSPASNRRAPITAVTRSGSPVPVNASDDEGTVTGPPPLLATRAGTAVVDDGPLVDVVAPAAVVDVELAVVVVVDPVGDVVVVDSGDVDVVDGASDVDVVVVGASVVVVDA